jgi:hypothetical protein
VCCEQTYLKAGKAGTCCESHGERDKCCEPTYLKVGKALVTVVLGVKLAVKVHVELEPVWTGPVCVVQPLVLGFDVAELFPVLGLFANESRHPGRSP